MTKRVCMAETFLRRGLKLSHLRLLALLNHDEGLGAAAATLGIAQPAASRLLSEAERITGCALRMRDGRGIRLTPEGRALAQRARRVLNELSDAERELGEISGGLSGDLRVGAVTGAAMERVLPALRSARLEMPGLRVHVEIANSEVLGEALAEGRIDLALARLPRDHPPELFDLRPIGEEPVALVVRRGHRLLAQASPAPEALMEHDWVLPEAGTILHDTVIDQLARRGLRAPMRRVTTSSVLLTLALVQRSNAIAPLARAVASEFATEACTMLPLDLGLSVAPYGLMTRKEAAPTMALRRFSALLTRDLPG
ncbi:LysR family transcriptional regulator [Limimaricola litoreus]|uniref:LysR family transcriptional regulator n=1 Tax=Limimaricola litoreus TaxID=2955316 RepID=A0A9X2FPT2_9RHOB|nr:LysR family transcriptional regulator [Limimaricola litoreus]MCP1169432.1 LysR family transcriptional regulator [Limimaricola litoreus]